MNKVYFPNLNGLRFLAAFSVMIYHFFGEKVLNGHFGVTLFFTLSGFLITYLLLVENGSESKILIRKFYIRRILRIWPLYFFVLALASFFYLPGYGLDKYLGVLPYYIFFIPNLAFVLNISLGYASILWSVGSEEQFYLIWPWLIKLIRNRYYLHTLLGIVLLWTFVPHVLDYVNSNYLGRIDFLTITSLFISRTGFSSMAMGAIFALLYYNRRDALRFFYNRLVQFVTISIILCFWIGGILPHVAIVDTFYSGLFAILILNLATNNDVIIGLENSILNYLGKISFGLYVFHRMAFELARFISEHMEIKINSLLIFVVGLLLTVIISSLSYYLLEKPFLKLKLARFTVVKSGNKL